MTTQNKICNDHHIRLTIKNRERLAKYLYSRFGEDWKKQRVISSTLNEALNKLLESEGF